MRVLIDNQLPKALARSFSAAGVDCEYVFEAGLAQASDSVIWQYACERGMVLVSKDEDFLHIAGRSGPAAPFVWVRVGNCRREDLLAIFNRMWPKIRACLDAGDMVVELR